MPERASSKSLLWLGSRQSHRRFIFCSFINEQHNYFDLSVTTEIFSHVFQKRKGYPIANSTNSVL